jgi:ribosomal protein L29
MPKKEIKKTEKSILSLKDMSSVELASKSQQLMADISKKKLEKTVGRLKNTRQIFMLRKELARVKTLISVKSKKQI